MKKERLMYPLNLTGSAGWLLSLVLVHHPLACGVALVVTGLCSTASAALALPERAAHARQT